MGPEKFPHLLPPIFQRDLHGLRPCRRLAIEALVKLLILVKCDVFFNYCSLLKDFRN